MSSPALQLRERIPRLAEDAVARARLSVVPRRRVRAPRLPFVVLVSLVLVGGVVGLLCFNTQMQQVSFAATTLQAEADNLSAREQTLHSDVQALNDPQNLAARAQALGMVVPQSACTVRLADQTTEQDCTPATNLNTPRLLPRPPKKPSVLNPKPIIVKVPALPGTTTGHHRHHHGKQARDTGRG